MHRFPEKVENAGLCTALHLKPACVLCLHPNLQVFSSFSLILLPQCHQSHCAGVVKVKTKPVFTSDSSEVMIPFQDLTRLSRLCANSPLISFNSCDHLLTSSAGGRTPSAVPSLLPMEPAASLQQSWSCQPGSAGDFLLSPPPPGLLALRELWRCHSRALAGSAKLPSRLTVSASDGPFVWSGKANADTSAESR